MKTIFLLLFPLFTYCQSIVNAKGDTVLIIDKSNIDTTVISVKTGEVFITQMKDTSDNHVLFIESKDKSYRKHLTMRNYYYFKPIE